MTWFKVDDSFYDHPKVFDAPDCAVALWVRAGCWAARNLTDGFVPLNMPARLCDDHETAVRQLLDHRLWSRTRGGYLFHDWHDYQPTADKVRQTRKSRAENGSKGGKAKAANQAKQTPSNLLETCQPFAKQNPAPTRPEPVPDLVSHLQVPDVRANDDDDLISEVAAKLAGKANRIVSAAEARSVVAEILARAERAGTPVHNRRRYVLASIDNEPDVYALILAPQLAEAASEPDAPPPWCGECYQTTRMLLDEFGQPGNQRCPECNPRSKARPA